MFWARGGLHPAALSREQGIREWAMADRLERYKERGWTDILGILFWHLFLHRFLNALQTTQPGDSVHLGSCQMCDRH